MNIGTHWYTNGTKQIIVHIGDPVPEGYHRGRLKSSESTRLKVSKSLKGNQRKRGKTESSATRLKKSKSLKGNTNSKGQDNHAHIGRIHIHKGDRTRSVPPEELDSYLNRGYKLGESPKHVRNKRANHSESKPEKDIRKYLISKGIKVIAQYQIPNEPHHFDFYLPDYNLLAEFDGTYWHRSQDYNNDPRQILAEKYNYRYLVIKESDYVTKGRLKYVKSRFSKYIECLRSTSHNIRS